MGTVDERGQEGARGEVIETSATEIEPLEPGDGVGGPIVLFFILGLVASLILGWVVFPKLLYSQKKQPIDFNHALHNGLVDEGCESCHFFREDGSFSGAPKLAQCIDCHEELQGEDPEEKKFVEEYVVPEREVPWLVYSRQPDCVFFSHAAHVKMDCVTCHGPIGESDHLKIYEENRITGYSRDIWGKNIAGFKKNSWDRMKMDDCSECHRQNNVNQASVQTHRGGCFVCHK
ncbi:MAG: cytochrome c3 family protein [Desulfobacterales bacterium]|nr:MAG: cytochrome c3 family protein [Desulfobacterales bacterium]